LFTNDLNKPFVVHLIVWPNQLLVPTLGDVQCDVVHVQLHEHDRDAPNDVPTDDAPTHDDPSDVLSDDPNDVPSDDPSDDDDGPSDDDPSDDGLNGDGVDSEPLHS
jgi:hypothetical protein